MLIDVKVLPVPAALSSDDTITPHRFGLPLVSPHNTVFGNNVTAICLCGFSTVTINCCIKGNDAFSFGLFGTKWRSGKRDFSNKNQML